jgi:fucose permease
MLPVTRRRAGTTPTSLALVGTSVIAVAYGFSRYGFGLFVPTFSDEFALTAATAGAISSTGYASYLLSMLSAGALTARFGPRLPVVLGAGCASAGMALVALAPTGAVLAAGVTLAGRAPACVGRRSPTPSRFRSQLRCAPASSR